MPSVQKRSLTATGTPPSDALRSTVGRRDLARDPRERVELVGERALAVGRPQLAGVDRAGAHALGGLGRGQLEQLAHAGAAPGLGHAEPVRRGVGRARERDLARQRRPRLVGAQRVLDRDDVRGRRDVVEVAELGDLLDVVEDARELPGHRRQLVLAQLEAGEAGDVQDLVAVQHCGADSRRARARARARRGAGSRGPSAGGAGRTSAGHRRVLARLVAHRAQPPAAIASRRGSRGRRRTSPR